MADLSVKEQRKEVYYASMVFRIVIRIVESYDSTIRGGAYDSESGGESENTESHVNRELDRGIVESGRFSDSGFSPDWRSPALIRAKPRPDSSEAQA
ncbi:hypothetical protein CDL15_Pgr013586 [Punica granatum]|uniref:Uncharacterized protein n=1 Tax=Punica granatum TaxID=22663 RepID=A0A218W1H5_PUNGR|nr:hypothetical protein CDL15_Pgr013586 [Punica granatum]